MLFCSQSFLNFFCDCLRPLPGFPLVTARIFVLLIASFYFYASWNRWLAALIGLTATFDFAVGLGLDRFRSARLRSILLGLSLVANLGLLAYFKYANFFLGSMESLLHALGSDASLPGVAGHAPDRDFVLYVRGDQLHRRRVSPPGSGRTQPRSFSALHHLLPPPRRGADCSRTRLLTSTPPGETVGLAADAA